MIRPDLISLCNNPNAGDFIISGWDPEQQPLSFVQEHGSHGSIGNQETRGFVLLPPGLFVRRRLGSNGEEYLRGVDLHAASLEFLRRSDDTDVERCKDAATAHNAGLIQPAGPSSPAAELQPRRLRVMTYNAHHCLGMDGRCRPERIANVIAESGADVVALQEMDDNRERTQLQNQTLFIASRLGMYHRFFPVLDEGSERYGLAILSRFPLSCVREEILTTAMPGRRTESRGAMWVSLKTDAGPVHFINTHLGLRTKERFRQVEELLGSRWLADIDTKEPVILCGDLNAGPNSEVMRCLRSRFRCAQASAKDHAPQGTFPSVLPLRRIDHILVSCHFTVDSVSVIRNHATTLASDHLPVCADVTVHRESSRRQEPDIHCEFGCLKPATSISMAATSGIAAGERL